jgi:hypothetical protein
MARITKKVIHHLGAEIRRLDADAIPARLPPAIAAALDRLQAGSHTDDDKSSRLHT